MVGNHVTLVLFVLEMRAKAIFTVMGNTAAKAVPNAHFISAVNVIGK
jgi:hypothetical protein